ncbi:MAG: toll/interleukin-1 receptor domain-containing protein [Catenulispora sp.]|nr:toll/interleukin-1 receptor domain-containing protein [Catenulispora sp.]
MAVSDRAPEGPGDGSAPYFFLSYARHHRSAGESPVGAEDPDRWTLRFFDDLTFEVMELTTLERGVQPGFMDREVHVGQHWRRRISEALAACRVFLPLYTPRYFTSLSCASEWYLFQARQSAHELISGSRPEAIIPVLWVPMPDTELPAVARTPQFDHRTLGEAYARFGFLQLIRLARYKDEYQLAIHALARHVVQVARDRSPGAAVPVDFTALHGRFEDADDMFAAAGDLVCCADAGRTALVLPGPRPALAGVGRLALPPGTGEPTSFGSAGFDPAGVDSADCDSAEGDAPCSPCAEAAVAAYLRTAHSKLAEWFTSHPAQVSSVDFDEFYFRTVHPAAKTALLRQLTPQTPPGPFPRPPRLRGDAADPRSGGSPHVP